MSSVPTRLRRVIACLAVSALLLGGAGASTAQPPTGHHPGGHHGPPAFPLLEATGEGTVSETPDVAIAWVGVTTQAPTAKEAMDRNAEITQNVVKALRDVGLNAPDAIRTQAIGVSPVTEGKPGERIRTVGYRASNQVETRVARISMLGPALDAALKAGATGIGAQRFALSAPQKTELRALEEAVKDARARIDTMAQALGRQVGRIVEVRFLDGPTSPPEPRFAQAAPAAVPIPVEPGTITVRARVLMRAELQ